MRDFSNMNRYMNSLLGDIYEQPPDPGHIQMLREVFHNWIPQLTSVKTVLDMGCGEVAIAEPFFKTLNIEYTGITLGKEATIARKRGRNVVNMDFNFLEFEDNSFDLIWSRHSLEHSPMPLLTLMEWGRVGKDFLCLILPNPDHFGWVGRNHYSVMNAPHAKWLLERAKWRAIWEDFSNAQEIRFMCEKIR